MTHGFSTTRRRAWLAGLSMLAACAPRREPPRFVATVLPAAYILRAVVGDSAAVAVLLPAGASPHTYEPRPSDVDAAQRARALFFVSPLLDGWAARLPARRHDELLAFVPAPMRRPLEEPARGDQTIDPHFWTDPRTVAAMLPALTDTLCAIDRAGCAGYRAHAAHFADTLRALDAELAATLAPLRGRAVVLFHPSFAYMLARYGIAIAGVIEPSPGKEPTPKDVEALAGAIRRTGAAVVFTESQLPRRPAAVVAEVAGVRLAELDPLGGVPGRDSYTALMRYNAAVLRRSVR